jgi:phosphoserine aminotransferase
MTMTAASPVAAAVNAASKRIFNFSAGPGVLPEEVLRQIQQDVWDIAGSGIGILEHSHRGKVVDKVWEDAEKDCREVGNIPANYKVIFVTGGASSQNHMIPMNLAPKGGPWKSADYIVTGYWAQKTFDEGKKLLGDMAHLAGTSEDRNHCYIPAQSQLKFSDNPAYVHYCSNNTIFGTEWFNEPTAPAGGGGVPLVCDASSDIYSKPIDITKYGMVYAGAQKNLGPAGCTVIMIREDLLERCPKEVPTMLQYRVHAKDGSRYNTPPVFSVYATGLVFKWIKSQGGLAKMAKYNQDKAKVIYDVLDSSKFFKGHADTAARSLMNITFRTPSEALDDKFVKDAKAAGMDGLKGHRATGGMRASTYNAFPKAGCEALAQFMREFERKNG